MILCMNFRIKKGQQKKCSFWTKLIDMNYRHKVSWILCHIQCRISLTSIVPKKYVMVSYPSDNNNEIKFMNYVVTKNKKHSQKELHMKLFHFVRKKHVMVQLKSPDYSSMPWQGLYVYLFLWVKVGRQKHVMWDEHQCIIANMAINLIRILDPTYAHRTLDYKKIL